MTWCFWIQDCALGAANPFCDKELVENGIAKFDTEGSSQIDTVLVFDDMERDDATPRFEGMRKPAFCWTPAAARRSSVKRMQAKGWTRVPRACAGCPGEGDT